MYSCTEKHGRTSTKTDTKTTIENRHINKQNTNTDNIKTDTNTDTKHIEEQTSAKHVSMCLCDTKTSKKINNSINIYLCVYVIQISTENN